MHTIRTLIRNVFDFGFLGCSEVIAAFMVATGCIGELWIILNKLTKHIEPLAKNSGIFWKVLAWADSIVKPIILHLKIKGRKLPQAKEELLERFFVMLIGLGVGAELICLMFSLHEIAWLNNTSAQLESTNLVLRGKVLELEAKTRPRRIGKEQRDIMLRTLKPTADEPVTVEFSKIDVEAAQIAQDIIEVLKVAGFDVRERSAIIMLEPQSLKAGLAISINANPQPNSALSIRKAFEDADIEMIWYGGGSKEMPIRIIVGAKNP